MKKLLCWIPILILAVACSPSPTPIEYGSDICEFCKMTIVDQRHGSELVSSKGKVYKFDAIECMVNYLSVNNQREYSHFLVNDYTNPGILIDATQSTFLISKSIPSPMGAFLSAFKSKDTALSIQKESGGKLYNWFELPNALKKGIGQNMATSTIN